MGQYQSRYCRAFAIPQVHSWEYQNEDSVNTEREEVKGTRDAHGFCVCMNARVKRMDAQDREIQEGNVTMQRTHPLWQDRERNPQTDLPALTAPGYNVLLFHCLESCSLPRHTESSCL